MSLDDIDATWAAINAEAVKTVAALQVASAREAVSYVAEVLDEQGMDAPSVATVEPLAFARGSSGLPLTDVLATVPARVKREIGNDSREVALDRGLRLLEGIMQTQVADAARLATVADSISRPDVQLYTRALNPPSCGRCAVLAGRTYRIQEPFKRHNGCDCRHVLSTEQPDDARLFDARGYFDGLSPADQDKHFGKGVAQRIRDGEDLVKAVNTSRDNYRVRLANERRAAKDAAVSLTTSTTPQTFMESLVNRVNRDQAIRNLADAGFVTAA